MEVYIVIEYTEPQCEYQHAITDLDLFFKEWNEDFDTDYTTMEEFNEKEIDRVMWQIKIPTEVND